MSDCESSEFNERLKELNNWQIAQQIKLKEFQEAQKRLLHSEYEKILSTLDTHNYEQRNMVQEVSHLNKAFKCNPRVSDKDNMNQNNLFNFKSDAIKLEDPKFDIGSKSIYSHFDNQSPDVEECNEDGQDNENEVHKPRQFLKRGDGLARFRMTLDDFRSTPSIYKEKKIKTYVSQKPEFIRGKNQSKPVRSVNQKSTKIKSYNAHTKPKAVPVKIYVNDPKGKNFGTALSRCDNKDNQLFSCTMKKKMACPKSGVNISTMNSTESSVGTKIVSDCSKFVKNSSEKIANMNAPLEDKNIENEIKKDERELRMFELLEGKIDDGTLSPNSSLVVKFMEDSISSTPSKITKQEIENNFAHSYIEGLRTMQRQYLSLDKITCFEECNIEMKSNENSENGSVILHEIVADDCQSEPDLQNDILVQNGDEKVCSKDTLSESSKESISVEVQSIGGPSSLMPHDFMEKNEATNNKTNSCGTHVYNEYELCSTKAKAEVDSHPVISHHDIAVKLQRKALQDNVKNILSWEMPLRKKLPKRCIKKNKMKFSNSQKLTSGSDDQGRNDYTASELKERLKELEKEIEIFKMENKNLVRLQRECDIEKMKLEKERKDFNKYMEQEKERFEAKLKEEQKKLQRDKVVFDQYCKQIRNQPNRKEREEITNLKKEIERLTEIIVTKDSRWGASQARLRNHIKSLENENNQLKAEIEKSKKQALKKVSFGNEKTIGTKIMNAINSELGKLKPHIVKNGNGKQRFQSFSARIEKNQDKKLVRRIRSVPDLKKTSCEDDDSVISTIISEGNIPSNVEIQNDKCEYFVPNVTRSGKKSQINDDDQESKSFSSEPNTKHVLTKLDMLSLKDNTDNNELGDLKNYTDVEKDNAESIRLSRDTDKTDVEPLIENGGQGDCSTTNGTIFEIKKRLENLNLLYCSQQYMHGDVNSVLLENHEKIANLSSSDTQGSSDDSDESQDQRADIKAWNTILSNVTNHANNASSTNTVCKTEVDNKGVREKTFEDGRKEIFYPNGNIKKVSADHKIVKTLYYNGDIKETNITEGSEKYFYAETKAWHTTYKDGLEVLEFSNGQSERRHPDGSTEISFPNGCVRYCDSSGKDEWRFVDGTVIKTDKNGHKVLVLPNGQKEVHTKEYKKREYPDGTIKLIYPDGTQETRYSTGRVRLKDKDGNLLMDSGGIF